MQQHRSQMLFSPLDFPEHAVEEEVRRLRGS